MILTRAHATAFVAAMVAALVGNALLQLGLDAVASGYGGGAPWWITAEIIDRGRWVALALILHAVAPVLLEDENRPGPAPSADRPACWRAVGVAVLCVPLLWILATWVVSALRFTLLGSWSTEGQAFLSPGYYGGLAMGYVPWLIGGGVVLGVRGHL